MTNASLDELSVDVVVVGAGTAGLAAAKSAHARGARVAIVDHGPLGTFCARLACMPSKALLQSTLELSRVRRAESLGIDAANVRFNWPVARARKSALVADFVRGVVEATTQSKNFALLHGTARFISDRVLDIDGRRVVAKRYVLATGSSTLRPPIPGLDELAGLAITSDDVFDLPSIPSSIAVIGAGPVAVELGQFLARAGARVHLIAHDDRIAGLGPGALQDALTTPLRRELTLLTATRVERVGLGPGGHEASLVLSSGEELRVEKILLAAGRRPNLGPLDLVRAGVQVEKGVPLYDEYLRTTNHAVFVAGDAAAEPALLHTAAAQGRAAGYNAASEGPDTELVRPKLEPALRIVFCDPIVATTGLDVEDAKRGGHEALAVSRPWSKQGKARLMGETEGVAQLVFDRLSRRLLGCQLVGPEADLLVHLASYALHFQASVDDLLVLPHYHPTLAEMIPSLAERAVSELNGIAWNRGENAALVAMQ